MGMNAKLSEYHAAVGLASLDTWPATRADWISVAASYNKNLGSNNMLELQPGFGQTWVSATCIVSVNDIDCAQAQHALSAAGIETRQWWGRGAHNYPATVGFPRTALPVTESLAARSFGLPFYRDLQHSQIREIVKILTCEVSS
jgi:dTDP-4-amino-4,6-dideoxygalactose transaminase